MNIRTRPVAEVMVKIIELIEKAQEVFAWRYHWDRAVFVITERPVDPRPPDRQVIDISNCPHPDDPLHQKAVSIVQLMDSPHCRSSRRREGPAGPPDACAIWFDQQHLISLAGPQDVVAEAILLCAGMALNIFSWCDAQDIIGPHDRAPFEALYADMVGVKFSEG